MGFCSPIGYAEFSKDGRYRYTLKFIWNKKLPRCCFVLLNPSTANAYKPDPTVKRCMKRAMRLGCGSVEIVNIFAIKATYPEDMLRHPRPIEGYPYFDGKRWWDSNAFAILKAVRRAKFVIAGWGNDGAHLNRDKQVCRLLKGYRVWCLKPRNEDALTSKQQPRHPLYLSYDCELHPFTPRGWKKPMRCTRRVHLLEETDDGNRVRKRLLQITGREEEGGQGGDAAGTGEVPARVVELNAEGRRERSARIDAERTERLRGGADRVGNELRGRSDGRQGGRTVQRQAGADNRKDLGREDREAEVDREPLFLKYLKGRSK